MHPSLCVDSWDVMENPGTMTSHQKQPTDQLDSSDIQMISKLKWGGGRHSYVILSILFILFIFLFCLYALKNSYFQWKVNAVENYPVPKTIKDDAIFQYYGRYVTDFAQVALPLNNY